MVERHEWTPEEQREHRRLLVAKLRSGDIPQARNRLRNGDAMCCLGVACEISGLGEWSDAGYYDGKFGCLPRNVRNWLGFATDTGDYWRGGEDTCLSYDNDHGSTFAEIADIIESEPEGLLSDAALGAK